MSSPRQRAKRGSITARMMLHLDDETGRLLTRELMAIQERGGLTNTSEWIREAIRQRAEREQRERERHGSE